MEYGVLVAVEAAVKKLREEINKRLETEQEVVIEKVREILNEYSQQCASANSEPSKLDRISLYIRLLNESQHAGADVQFELESALSSFKKEAGI